MTASGIRQQIDLAPDSCHTRGRTFFSFLKLILQLCIIQECEEYCLTLGFQQQSETKCHIVLASTANAEEVIRIQSNVNHRTVNGCKKIHPFTKFYNYDRYNGDEGS